MKMNGLDPRHYWINFFFVSFSLSMLTSLNMYIFGTWIIEIPYFMNTSACLLWIIFIGWAIAQIAMTSLFQIFIDNSKTATIIGYILSIFSTLVGMVLSSVIFPYPMKFPTTLLMYPPFALSRAIFHLGVACSGTS
jgi:hypothetical protein